MGADSSRNGEGSGENTWLFVLPWDLHYAGGVNQVVINLYRCLEGRGSYRPLLLVAKWKKRVGIQSVVDGRKTVFFRLRRPPTTFREAVAWLLKGGEELRGLNRLLRDENVQVINVHYPGCNAFAFALLKQFGFFQGRIILSFHGLDLQRAVESRGVQKIVWKFLKRTADKASACSDALAASVEKFFGVHSHKVFTMHNGVEFVEESSVSFGEYRDITYSKNFLLNVATYEWKKGQDVLIAAFAKLANRYPSCQLVLVGRDGGLKEELVAESRRLGIGKRVVFAGELPHGATLSLFRDARALVLPSRQEPFGIVILEAGMMGVPVIASRVGGIPEIICSDEYGTLVPPDDVEALRGAIENLLAHPVSARLKADRLKGRVRERFTWTHACELLEGSVGTGKASVAGEQ